MSIPKSKSKRRISSDLWEADSSSAEAVAHLAWAAPAARPAAAAKTRLLARVRAEKSGVESGWRFASLASSKGAAGWIDVPFPGVKLRELAIDAARDTALLYIEMAPKAVFPDHEHSATERGLLLSGDLRMGKRQLDAGDFYEAAAGTWHERISSPSGCTGLLWVGERAWRTWRAAMAAASRK